MTEPRLFQFLYAKLFGYFWLPCPICGKNFGGHEKHGSLMTSWDGGIMTCPDCAEEAEHRNQLFMQDHPAP